jgi:2-polyprenyl-6-methoxyphenol hydroxylase-like FAD-dependent oxidoreductase
VNKPSSDAPGLDWLEERVRHEIDLLRHNYHPWVPPAGDVDGRPVLDVVIVGGGLYGLGLAWGLMRAKVTNILVLDQAPLGREGPWMTFARMPTLRTAKQLTGIEFGIPSLSLRAYWEAKFGPTSWEALSLTPRLEWVAYLEWFRRILDIPVQNETEVLSIDGDSGLARITVRRDGETSELLARRVVLATGLLGSGGKHVPVGLTENLAADCWAHAADNIDFTKLAGRDVRVPQRSTMQLSPLSKAQADQRCSAAVQNCHGSVRKRSWRMLASCAISRTSRTSIAGASLKELRRRRSHRPGIQSSGSWNETIPNFASAVRGMRREWRATR